MVDFNILTHETIDIFALKHYDNRGAGKEEFEDDLKRFKYLKRLFRKYDTSKEFKWEKQENNQFKVFASLI